VIFEAIFSFCALVVQATKSTVKEFVKEIAVQVISEAGKSRSSLEAEVKRLQNELNYFGREMGEFEEKIRQDGKLSRSDQYKYDYLVGKQKEGFDNFLDSSGDLAKARVVSEPDKHEATVLSTTNVNLLEYHLGNPVSEKICPSCHSPMKLKLRSQADFTKQNSLDMFFWGCPGFFLDKEDPAYCKTTLQFKESDFSVLHLAGIPEIELPNQDLIRIASQKPIIKLMDERMHEHISKADEEIRCPVHKVAMILKEKRDPVHPLDAFYLRCPNANCQQTEKLKTYPQLAAFLRRREGSGLLL
jgi:hypothetical protein